MTDDIKLPPYPEGLCLREDIEDYAREAVRLNAPAVPDGDAAEAIHDTNAVLASRYFELLKVVEAYEKRGVTCQTFRHFVDTPCAECNCAPAAPAAPAAPQPAQSELAPAGSGGWESHAKELERELAYWKQRAKTILEHRDGECWYWQGDGTDHPESMVDSLPVVIRADELRALMAPAAPQPAQQTCNCRWAGDVQVQQCTLHQAHVEAIHEWAERAKTAEAKLNAQQPLTDEKDALLRQALEPDLEDHEYELWGQNVKADFVTVEKAIAYAREAVRLNAQSVPDGWVLVPVEPTPEMLAAGAVSVLPQASNDIELARSAAMIVLCKPDAPSGVPMELLAATIATMAPYYRAMLSAAPAAPQPAQPLTDEQCDAIYMALDNWAREFDEYEFGLPHSCGGGVEGGREIIRNAISGVKND